VLRSLWKAAANVGGGLALCLALMASGSASGRDLQVEDLLAREGLGAVEVAPGDRWLLVEQRVGFASASRFDFQDLNRLFRTRIMIADLANGGPLRELFPRDSMTGYQLGPISPHGKRIVVYRLTAERWELGVATLPSGDVLWTGLTPEAGGVARRVQWASDDTLLAIALPPGAWPFDIRVYRPQAESPALWAASARGEAAVSVVNSGPSSRPRPPGVKRVVSLSATTGAIETLATGDFMDLDLAPSGRRLALLEAGEDVPLIAGRPIHGAYGLAMRRTRLRVLDLESRDLATPCPRCDVLSSFLSWRPVRDELLAYVRDDGATWASGRLLRIDAVGGGTAVIGRDLAVAFVLRPERIAAGWLGGDPIVFGRRPGAARDDWFRLSGGASVRLTEGLARPTREVVVAGGALLAAADGAAWRIDHERRAQRLTRGVFTPTVRRSDDLAERTIDGAVRGEALTGVETLEGTSVARRLGASTGAPAGGGLAANGAVLLVTPRGVLFDVVSGGGEERLVWRRADASDTVLLTFNRHLADVDRPPPIAIRHPGPDGQPLTSWLYVPARHAGPPPPLVVVPYPERIYTGPPTRFWNDAPISPGAALLGHGYAVLLPSLPSAVRNSGPADGLAERVLAIIDAAARQPDTVGRFDAERLALWGHSFGAYAVATVIGQTDRFRGAIAVAPATDLISRHGQFGAGRRIFASDVAPTSWSAGWVETLQGDMRAPPWEDPQRYVLNSPLFEAGRIKTPLLIASGEIDGSHAGQAEELFSALYRQSKEVTLLTYWGEGHLFGSPGNLRDLYARAFAFLAEHLGPPPLEADLTAAVAPLPPHPAPGPANGAPMLPPPPPR